MFPTDTIDSLVGYVHNANKKWWHDPATGEPLDPQKLIPEKLLLIHSEISEAVEGHRKNLPDDKLPQYPMIGVELVDAVIRIFDLAGALDLPFGEMFQAKMEYNATRKDHTNEARLAEGGKRY